MFSRPYSYLPIAYVSLSPCLAISFIFWHKYKY
jgi:hypothetical protein